MLSPFQRRRQSFKTRLIFEGPSPYIIQKLHLPTNTARMMYKSESRDLQVFVQTPHPASPAMYPVVIYFHGGCGIYDDHFLGTQLFLDAGYAVISPTFRGENGNPGAYELFLGEVTDACHAVRWASDQEFVDKRMIYAFGYSMGGEIAALLSLFEGLPLRFTGSCGPFFARPDMFGEKSMFNTPVPFDTTDKNETAVRTLANNYQDMRLRHRAFIGVDDEQFGNNAYREINTDGLLVVIVEVPGDHDSSLTHAIDGFIRLMEEDIRAIDVGKVP